MVRSVRDKDKIKRWTRDGGRVSIPTQTPTLDDGKARTGKRNKQLKRRNDVKREKI
jgi:hypothetical protein